MCRVHERLLKHQRHITARVSLGLSLASLRDRAVAPIHCPTHVLLVLLLFLSGKPPREVVAQELGVGTIATDLASPAAAARTTTSTATQEPLTSEVLQRAEQGAQQLQENSPQYAPQQQQQQGAQQQWQEQLPEQQQQQQQQQEGAPAAAAETTTLSQPQLQQSPEAEQAQQFQQAQQAGPSQQAQQAQQAGPSQQAQSGPVVLRQECADVPISTSQLALANMAELIVTGGMGRRMNVTV